MSDDLMQKVISLCKRRGFVFQSSDIYGGLKSAYDYGPLGVEMKRNLMNAWWRDTVQSRENIVGLDASIIMHPRVWEASGHLSGFSDPLVDCKVCKERFRADKAVEVEEGEPLVLTFADKGRAKTAQAQIAEQFGVSLEREGRTLKGAHAGNRGYVCPVCNSPFMSEERQFNTMFRTSLGPIDPLGRFAHAIESGALDGLKGQALLSELATISKESAVYLRPETAQAMFVQFNNVQQSMSLKVPFGIAQMGKSFRNEITVEHFIFRSCEFEQMEMEFFCEPGTDDEWLEYWKTERMNWWKKYANDPSKFRLRAHEADELAHYAKGCFDVEYEFNSYGAKDIQRKKKDKFNRTILIGDSFVEGYGLNNINTISKNLETLSGKEYLNFGTSGHFGTTQYRLLYEHLASDFDHNTVMVFLTVTNDFEDDSFEFGKSYHKNRFRPYLVRINNNLS